MIRHIQRIRTRRHQRHRRLTVQKTSRRRRHVLVDRLVHELMPEDDALVRLVEKLSVERIAQPAHYLRWRPVGDSSDIAKRHGIAQHLQDQAARHGRVWRRDRGH